nr:hypothetical protein [Actinomyces sp.]
MALPAHSPSGDQAALAALDNGHDVLPDGAVRPEVLFSSTAITSLASVSRRAASSSLAVGR